MSKATVGDRIGRRKLLLIGAVGAASVVAAFANSAGTLIAMRAAGRADSQIAVAGSRDTRLGDT